MKKGSLLVVVFLLSVVVSAKVTLPVLVSDGMVLQRGETLKIWGSADAGEQVTVKFLRKKYQTTADDAGNWSVQIPPLKAGGPYSMKINDITLKNVLVGEVWLNSGQSNMELPMRRVMDLYAHEEETYSNPLIHYMKVPLTYNFHGPQKNIAPCKWEALNPKNAYEFSAFSYFFAKDLYDALKVPIGIINSSVGGSPVQAWISEDSLKDFPAYISEEKMCADDQYVRNIQMAERYSSMTWEKVLAEQDKGLTGEMPWYAEYLDDSDWRTVDLFSTDWGRNGRMPINGSHWFRKHVDLPQAMAGQPAVLRMGRIVDADSVFVNGVFVGNITYQYPPRIYHVPAGVLKAGENVVTCRLVSSGGFPEFVTDKPYKIIAVGDTVSLEGNWKYKLGAVMPSAPGTTFFQYKPTGLYNAMIAPLFNYVVKGVVWYQGESNAGYPWSYGKMLTSMIDDWRVGFDVPNVPFFIIQLPNFMQYHSQPVNSNWAELRWQQFKVARDVPNTYLVTTIDIGEWNDIHPLHKEEVGHRTSLQAQKYIYGNAEIVSSGPIYDSMKVEENRCIITFKPGTDDLQQVSDLKGFEVADSDGIFKLAKAKIVGGNKVEVWNDEIIHPLIVRYAWDDNPRNANLKNKAGLPASPFTTPK